MAGTLSGILSIGRSALLTHQKSVATASHNIANANTPGYSRQRADLAANLPQVWPQGAIGTGVHLGGVERARDILLDQSVRDHAAVAAGFEQRSGTLSRIETALAEPTDAGLAATLDQFWNAWGDLSNNPTSSAARLQVAEKGRAVANVFGRLQAGIDEARATASGRIQGDLDHVNQLAQQIADINQRIVDIEAGSATANDLRDQRDLLTDELSSYIPVTVVERTGGATGVYVDGLAMVDGAFTRPLSMTTSGSTYQILTPGGAQVSTATGRLGASLDILNSELPAFESQLDGLAAGLVAGVNTIHQTGTNPNGNTGVDFFDPAGTTARTISLSAAVAADSLEVAAGTPDGLGQYQAGANDVSLSLQGLRDVGQATLGGQTFGAYYGDFVADIGLAVSSAESGFQTHDALRSQADARRSEVSGVSVDEELVDLMRFQQAFAAAARLVNTADEMMQTVLGMV